MQNVQTQRKWMLGRLVSLILAKLLSPLATFTIIIAVARMLGKTDLGRYNTVLAWYALFQFISLFGMSEFVAREVGKDNSKASKYLFHGLLFGLLASVLCLSIMVCSGYLFDYSKQLQYSIMIAGLALPFGGWTLLCHSVFTAFEKIGYIALSAFVESVLVLSFSMYCIYNQFGIAAIMFGLVAGKGLASLFTLVLVHFRVSSIFCSIDTDFLKTILRPVFAFGLTGVAFHVFMRSGVIVLSRLSTMETVGLYSSASKLTEICLMLPIAFYILMLPIISRDYKASPDTAHHKLERYSCELFIVVFFVFGVGVFFSKDILQIIYGADYLVAVWPLRILLVAYLIQCSDMILGMFCQAANHHKFAMKAAMLRAIVNIILCVIFISIWPLFGAAVAMLLSVGLSFVIFQVFVVKRLYSFDWSLIILKPSLVCFVTTVLMLFARDSMSLVSQVVSYSVVYVIGLMIIYKVSPISTKCDKGIEEIPSS